MQGTGPPADHNRPDHACRMIEQLVPGRVWWMIGADQMVPAPEWLHILRDGRKGVLQSLRRRADLDLVLWLFGSLWVYVTSVICLFLSSHAQVLPRSRDRPHAAHSPRLVRHPSMPTLTIAIAFMREEGSTYGTHRKLGICRNPTWTASSSADPTGPMARFRCCPDSFRRAMLVSHTLHQLPRSCSCYLDVGPRLHES